MSKIKPSEAVRAVFNAYILPKAMTKMGLRTFANCWELIANRGDAAELKDEQIVDLLEHYIYEKKVR